METRDFFISYTKNDLNWAKRVVEILENHGYTVYYQKEDSKGDFIEWIDQAINASRNFIVLWSKSTDKSRHCKRECRIAVKKEIDGKIDLLLPLNIEKDATPYSVLELYTHANLFGLQEDKLENELLQSVKSVQPSKFTQKSAPNFDDGSKYYEMGEQSYNVKNYTKAREYFEKAAKMNNSDAIAYLGYFYKNGLGVAQNYTKAREYYEQAAKQNEAYALNNLGNIYYYGLGLKQDYEIARQYYEKAAEKGNAYALDNLGFLYDNGYGVEQDYEIARQYYERAIAKGTEIGDEDVVKSATDNLNFLFRKLKRE